MYYVQYISKDLAFNSQFTYPIISMAVASNATAIFSEYDFKSLNTFTSLANTLHRCQFINAFFKNFPYKSYCRILFNEKLLKFRGLS